MQCYSIYNKKTYLNKSLILIFSISIIFLAEASPAISQQQCSVFRASKMANSYSKSIIENKLESFGSNIYTNVEKCTHYPEEKGWIISMEVGWNGLFTGDLYRAKGRLTLAPQEASWETTWANPSLLGWWVLQGVTVSIVKELNQK